ncbi:MAG: ATP-binding protein [Flavobacteriales bacterium]|nr:ATP-binding protein [Flavobacteriales bacterium]
MKPIIPDTVNRLTAAREYSDVDAQNLIDMQLIHLGRKYLGDYTNKPLLSLPPESVAKRKFHFGNILYDKERWPFGISEQELLQSVTILGRSGSGKTNCTFILLEQLVDAGIPFLYLDWKRTARHMLPRLQKKVNVYTPGRSLSPFPFNPFIPPPGIEKHIYAGQVIDSLASAYTLGDGATSLLQKALKECYDNATQWPSIAEVRKRIEYMETKERANGWKISLLRALQTLESSQMVSNDEKSQRVLVATLCKSNTILELDGLNRNAKKFLVPLICSWVYHYRLVQPDRETLRMVIFVEEAHHLIYKQERRAHEPLMETLIRQCREVGIGMVVVDQHPHLLSSSALGNYYTTICLNLKEPTDIHKAAGLCNLDEKDKRHFSELPVGQGIVKLQDRWHQPILVQFPLMNIQKGYVTDTMIANRVFTPKPAQSGLSNSQGLKSSTIRHNLLAYPPLKDECFQFLKDVLAHKLDGVNARYKRLRWGTYKGLRIKNRLVRSGWLEQERIETGNTRKLMIRPSAEFKRILGHANTRESITHEYWKHWYAEKLKQQGFQVRLEATRHGGTVDILAFDDKQQIGVEIETGKSDMLSNVKNGLLSRFNKIIVIATDRRSNSVIEKQLAKQYLLLKSRLRLVLAGGEF